ncbi:MAG: aminotransferase class III-fold pyridoxal phosphate-dependent enzyme, partial [Planctomycetota bacterium]|nr:aminotransferase class III-fold pyridoxal phosphate-dependent enzyme [Planctomycetota bacterium]
GARDEFLESFAVNLPDGEWRAFLSNSGAEANENALKAAFDAFSGSERSVVVAFTGAFHGRTAAAEAASDRPGSYPRATFDVRRLAFGDAAAVEAGVTDDVAAVILEPIQSLAGVVVPPPGWLELVRERCDAVGALFVFDEVQTGNGRLGTPWATQRFGVIPDIFTTAKGAAGGLPIGVTVMREEVAARVDPTRCGSTFGGGPTVLAAATEVARRISAPGFLGNVRDAGEALREAALAGPVAAVRGEGLLLGLVLKEGLAAATVRDHLLEAGVLVGTSGDPRVLRLSPPLTLRPKEAARLGDAFASLKIEVTA